MESWLEGHQVLTGEMSVEVSRPCRAVPHLLGMKAPHGSRGAQGLLSIVPAAGVHNRALLQHSEPCLCAAAMALSKAMDTN